MTLTTPHKYLIGGLLLGLAIAWIYHRRQGGGPAAE